MRKGISLFRYPSLFHTQDNWLKVILSAPSHSLAVTNATEDSRHEVIMTKNGLIFQIKKVSKNFNAGRREKMMF